MSDRLADVVQADLDALRPRHVPPFAVIRARRARQLRRRARLVVGGAALAAAGLAAVPAVIGPGGQAADSAAAAPRVVGQQVPQDELRFGTTEQDAAGPGQVLTDEVDGISLVGYRNAEGTVCAVDLPAGYPVCFPGGDFRPPTDQVVLLGPADPPGPAGPPARRRTLTFGYAPPGSVSVTLQRDARPALNVQTHPAGPTFPRLAFFLAPFDSDVVGAAATYTAHDGTGRALATRRQPRADSIREVADAHRSRLDECLAAEGYPSTTGPGGGRQRTISGPGADYEQAAAAFEAAELACQRSMGNNLVAPPPYGEPARTGPADPPVQVLAPRPGDSALGRVVLPQEVRNNLTDLPPGDAPADLLARMVTDRGTLYLAGVTRERGRIRACTTSFRDGARVRAAGGISCSGGDTAHGDVSADALATGRSWGIETPDRSLLEGSAPAGTVRVRIEPENAAAILLTVASAGPRWGDRVYFVADIPRQAATVTAYDAQGRATARARSAGV